MSNPIVVGEDGKPKFVGIDDPSNRAYTPPPPNTRLCSRCNKRVDNTNAVCPTCQGDFGDSKMECPVCHRYFDYLLGENTHDGGKMGCEGCWKPPQGPQRKEGEEVYVKDITE